MKRSGGWKRKTVSPPPPRPTAIFFARNPEFARFLVEEGIDSISLNPDAVMKTTVMILEAERAEAA